jgi:hypothetical protein
MTKLGKQLILAFGIVAIGIGAALADGEGGDSGNSSMSQWTGGSYAAFHNGLVGDFRSPRDKYAEKKAERTYPAAEPSTEVIASLGKRGGHPINPFRDDTGA